MAVQVTKNKRVVIFEERENRIKVEPIALLTRRRRRNVDVENVDVGVVDNSRDSEKFRVSVVE